MFLLLVKLYGNVLSEAAGPVYMTSHFVFSLQPKEPTTKTTGRPRYDLAVGLKKGFKTTKNPQKPRPSRRKGVSLLHHTHDVNSLLYCPVLFVETY